MKPLFFALALSLAWLSTANVSWASEEDPVARDEVRASIEKALPYIQKRGQWWIDKKECMSCHRTSFMAWSHIEAAAAGLEVDQEQVNQWIDWSHDNLFSPFPEKDQKFEGEQTIERNLSGAAQMLALAKNWTPTADQRAMHLEIIERLKAGQQEAGHWVPRGQLPQQKRELTETTQVITLWNTLALIQISEAPHIDASQVEPLIESAQRSVTAYQKGKSSEWLALRMLFAQKRKRPGEFQSFKKRTLDTQNDDGGWGWIAGEASDVLATAQVIYALQETGHAANSKELQRAIRYLLDNQLANGSWKVNGTKQKTKDKPHETANYWGTTWSTIALSRTLGTASDQAEKSE